MFSVRESRTWRQAATRFLEEYQHQRSIWLSAIYLKQLDPYIGDLFVHEIDDEALQPCVEDRQEAGRSNRTINIALQRVVRILNLCARKWRDDHKRPWLDSVPMIEMLSEKKCRQPYPLSWDEQAVLFKELPDHLLAMALYKVNTGCREQEVCKLCWEWEIEVPELGTSVFLLPADFGGRFEDSGVKNGEERLVVLNDVARSVIRKQRGQDEEWVFSYEGRPSAPNERHGLAQCAKASRGLVAGITQARTAPRLCQTAGAGPETYVRAKASRGRRSRGGLQGPDRAHRRQHYFALLDSGAVQADRACKQGICYRFAQSGVDGVEAANCIDPAKVPQKRKAVSEYSH